MSGKLSDIVTLNNELKKGTSPVAFVIGGTSGIGLAIVKAIVKRTDAPRVYFSGRNKAAAETIIAEGKKLNENAKLVFLPTDVYLLANVVKLAKDFVEEELKQDGINSETDIKLNILVNSTGTFNTDTTPTKEGFIREMVSRHYSRILSINQLLPYLQNAAPTQIGARVLSVFAAGQEAELNTEDVSCQEPKNASFAKAIYQASTLQTLLTEELAIRFPEISFLHIHPGVVFTGILRELPLWAKILATVFLPFMKLFATDPDEVGDRLLRLLTDDKHKTGSHLLSYDGNVNRDWRVKGLKQWKAGTPEWEAKRKEWREIAWNNAEKVWKETVPDAYRSW